MQQNIYNREFEFIDTQEKAYVLGLFYADGYICSVNNDCGITLISDDSYILYKIQELFKFFTVRKSHNNHFKLQCCNKQLKKDLINLGVLERKSTDNRFFLRFPNIDKSLYHHFIRGYFDGDGGVYRQKINNIKIDIGGTCFYFITDLIKVLYDNKISVNLTVKYSGSGLRTIDYYIIYTSSYKESKKFFDYIYKNSSLHLERKYKGFELVEIVERTRAICPKCGSNQTLFNGFRNNKTRIKCKNCNKMSTIIEAAPINSNINSGEGELLED